MKKGLWVVLIITLAGILPAMTAYTFKYIDVCNASKTAYQDGLYISAIDLAQDAFDLLPFIPYPKNLQKKYYESIVNNPVDAFLNEEKDAAWPNIKNELLALSINLSPIFPENKLASDFALMVSQLQTEVENDLKQELDHKDVGSALYSLGVLSQLDYGNTKNEQETFSDAVLNIGDQISRDDTLPLYTFIKLSRLKKELPAQLEPPDLSRIIEDSSFRLAKELANSYISSINANSIESINLRQYLDETNGKLEPYSNHEAIQLLNQRFAEQIQIIAANNADKTSDLNVLVCQIAILMQSGYGSNDVEVNNLTGWLMRCNEALRRNRYRDVFFLLSKLQTICPNCSPVQEPGRTISDLIDTCKLEKGIKVPDRGNLHNIFDTEGFIVFPSTSTETVASLKLTTEISHGDTSTYSSSGYGYSNTSRSDATATMTAAIYNYRGRKIRTIPVYNTEKAPRSLSYYSSSSSSSGIRNAKPSQETIDENARKGLLEKLESKLIQEIRNVEL